MRTQQDIVNRIDEIKKNDVLGFQTGDYLPYLEYESILPHVLTKEQYEKKVRIPLTDEQYKAIIMEGVGLKIDRDNLIEQMKEYMPFAWEKANGFRGISACRSMEHFIAWLWLIEDPLYKVVEKEMEDNYLFYGKDILFMICANFGWDTSEWDDGVRANSESEAEGGE